MVKPDEVLAKVVTRSNYFKMWKMKQLLIPRKRENVVSLPKAESEERWDGVYDDVKSQEEWFIPMQAGSSSNGFDMFGHTTD